MSQALAVVSQRRARAPTRCAARLSALSPSARAPNACAVLQVQWLYCNTALPISLTWSQYTKVYCDTMSNCQPFPGHDTKLYCDPIPFQASLLYCNTKPSCNTISAHPSCLSCNTIIVLQYNPQQPPLAIQTQPLHTQVAIQSVYCNIMAQQLTSLLQYNSSHPTSLVNLQYTLYCNTIFFFSQYNWAVAQISPSTKFYFFFHIYFFFHFSSYWKIPKNIYIPFFFHFPEHSNKFIKIYFIHFSLTLHTVKLLEKYFFSS